MIGPAARIAGRVDVLPAKEIGLHIHLLDLELTLLDLLVDVLVTRIEAAHVSAHRDDAGFLRNLHQRFGILDAVGDRDLDEHMLGGAHDLLALAEMHLGRRGENDGVGALDAFREVASVVRNAVFLGDRGGRVLIAANQRSHLDLWNALERIKMLLPEGTLPGNANLHRPPFRMSIFRRAAARLILPAAGRLPATLRLFSRMMCPTAVLDAGTV